MKRRYIAERGSKIPFNDRQPRIDRHTPINEALDIFIRAKEAEGVRPGTVRNYRDVVQYLQDWLEEEIQDINNITADIIPSCEIYLGRQ